MLVDNRDPGAIYSIEKGKRMGLSIFYSLSLPATFDAGEVEAKLTVLANTVQRLAEGKDIKVSQIRRLSAANCAMAQAKMNDNFDFARSVCQPPGARRDSPLGAVPEIAMYFKIFTRADSGINIGLAKYTDRIEFQMIGKDGNTETPYDGRWYFWTFIDVFSNDEAILLDALIDLDTSTFAACSPRKTCAAGIGILPWLKWSCVANLTG